MMDIEAGTYYRLKAPKWTRTLGQGLPPEDLVVSRGDTSVSIEWGSVVRASESVDPPGDDTKSPVVVHVDVLRALQEQIEQVPQD